jgi:hypothetical protein
MTKNTPSTSMPILFYKIIFGENNPATKISSNFFGFLWYFHLPNFLVIINWYIRLKDRFVKGVYQKGAIGV